MKTKEEILRSVCKYHDSDEMNHNDDITISEAKEAMQEYADQEKPKWINTSEQLPELGKMVLVTTRKYDLILSASMVNDDGTLFGVKFGNGKYYELVSVTHWMPLPEKPEL